MSVHAMHFQLLLDRLRKDFREALNTLIAAGVSEQDARLAALAVLDKFRHDEATYWMGAVDEEDD